MTAIPDVLLAECRYDALRPISHFRHRSTWIVLRLPTSCLHRRQSPSVPDQARLALASDISPHPLPKFPLLTNSPVGPLIRRVYPPIVRCKNRGPLGLTNGPMTSFALPSADSTVCTSFQRPRPPSKFFIAREPSGVWSQDSRSSEGTAGHRRYRSPESTDASSTSLQCPESPLSRNPYDVAVLYLRYCTSHPLILLAMLPMPSI